MPGPISSTVSSLVIPAPWMILSSTWLSIRKFWPKRFLKLNSYSLMRAMVFWGLMSFSVSFIKTFLPERLKRTGLRESLGGRS